MADRTYEFTLTGVTPLIMHWDNIEGSDFLEDWRAKPENKDASKPGDDRSPPWVWKNYLYNDGERIVLPEDVFRACLLKAGAKVPMKGKGKKTFKTETQTGLVLLSPFLDFTNNGKVIAMKDIEAIDGLFLENCEAARSLGFQLFVKRATVGASKHIRVRPRFDAWSCSGKILVTEPLITAKVLQDILDQGGNYVGLCDWRPSAPKSPGPYGRFTAKLKAA